MKLTNCMILISYYLLISSNILGVYARRKRHSKRRSLSKELDVEDSGKEFAKGFIIAFFAQLQDAKKFEGDTFFHTMNQCVEPKEAEKEKEEEKKEEEKNIDDNFKLNTLNFIFFNMMRDNLQNDLNKNGEIYVEKAELLYVCQEIKNINDFYSKLNDPENYDKQNKCIVGKYKEHKKQECPFNVDFDKNNKEFEKSLTDAKNKLKALLKFKNKIFEIHNKDLQLDDECKNKQKEFYSPFNIVDLLYNFYRFASHKLYCTFEKINANVLKKDGVTEGAGKKVKEMVQDIEEVQGSGKVPKKVISFIKENIFLHLNIIQQISEELFPIKEDKEIDYDIFKNIGLKLGTMFQIEQFKQKRK